MAQSHASHERLAALSDVARAPHPDAAAGDADSAPAEVLEAPDPRFWGPEPRAVRRGRRGADDAVETPRRRSGVERLAVGRWWQPWLERARDARLEVGIGVLVVALVALAAGVVWYRMGAGEGAAPQRSVASAPSVAAASSVSAASSTPSSGAASAAAGRAGRGDAAAVVVHVAGAVTKPGVLLMPAGARVIDAVEGAGGALADADLDRLNLAAKLVDGQRVLVVKVGAVVAAGTAGSSGVPARSDDPGALIDLNAATGAQLETLPGIGPALAGAIIAERDRRGGFRSVNELREVRGIGEVRFADLRERVTA